MPRKFYNAGFIAYALLIGLSLLFYQERTAFLDIAYHLFYILKDNDCTIQNFRFAAVFTQVFPLMASRLELPLSMVMMAYSVGFYLYYLACYILCGSVLKNYRAALLVLMVNILAVADTFYWIQSEFPQGLALMAVLLAFIQDERAQRSTFLLRWLLNAALSVTVAFSHPLMVFPLAYALLFFLLKGERTVKRRVLLFTAILFLAAWGIRTVFFMTEYDRHAASNIQKLKEQWPDYLMIYANKRFALDCIYKFYWLLILLLVAVVHYLRKRQWLLLSMLTCFFWGYLLLVNVSYPGRNVSSFYMENMYLPLTIIVALPVIWDVLQEPGNGRLVTVGFSLVIITGLLRIWFYHGPYSARLAWEDRYLKHHIHEKLVVSEYAVPMDTLMTSWGTPYEFWLLSTVRTGRSASVVITENPSSLEWTRDNSKAFVTVWGVFPYRDLNSYYFRFRDTVSEYRLIQ